MKHFTYTEKKDFDCSRFLITDNGGQKGLPQCCSSVERKELPGIILYPGKYSSEIKVNQGIFKQIKHNLSSVVLFQRQKLKKFSTKKKIRKEISKRKTKQ